MALRTLHEIKAPFENAILPVPQAGLNLLKEPEELITACYAKTMWRQNLKTREYTIFVHYLLFLLYTCSGAVCERLTTICQTIIYEKGGLYYHRLLDGVEKNSSCD